MQKIFKRIKKYKTDRDGNIISGKCIGILVGKKLDDNTYGIGWSLCRKGDKFDKVLGLSLAEERAASVCAPIPRSIVGQWEQFRERCTDYFTSKTPGMKFNLA